MSDFELESEHIENGEPRLGYRTWIEISREAIAENFKIFRSLIKPSIKLLAVVKSNAYGQGLVGFSKEAVSAGVDWLATDSIVEALRLRKEGIEKPILVLGYTLPERVQEAIDHNISITISNMFALTDFEKHDFKGVCKVHIKVDTGMHRQGFLQEEIGAVVETLQASSQKIHAEGLYTHFASAKDVAQKEETHAQLEVFKLWIDAFKDAKFSPIIHAAATGATLLFPETHFDMVRVGIGSQGVWPSSEAKSYLQKKINLKPTISWKTIVSEIKTIPKGSRIGYDYTEEMKRETKMAVCPIGYWHGYFRSLSSVGIVLVNGVRCKVLGRVSMDMIVIDVTDVKNPAVGDEVVLIGQSGKEYLGAEELAGLAGVSTYEFVTRLNPLIKKFYI